MRALLLFLVAGLAALSLTLVGCGGDDEQQQTQQTLQSQQAAEQQQETTAARPTPERAEQNEQEQSQDEQPVVEQQSQDQPVQQEGFGDPLLDEAHAAYISWSENLETIVLEVEADFNLAGLAAQMSAAVSAQFDPVMILTTLDASQLFSMFGDTGDDEDAAEGLLVMAILMTEDAVYLTMPEAGGWIDLTSEADGVLEGLTGILGGNPDELADPAQFGLAFGCIDTVGGSITIGDHEGEPAWIIDCDIDIEALNESTLAALETQGVVTADNFFETMHLRLVISQDSGAPLVVETQATLVDAFGLSDDAADDPDDEAQFYVNTVTYLRSWNEPIDFPAPEPIVDGSLLDAFASSAESPGSDADPGPPPELLTSEELVDLASAWAAAADELHLQFVTQAVIDGEPRLAATTVRGSRSQGAFETSVNIDDASTFRLLWNRDGIWVSDSEENGQAIWAPSNPALLGFAGQTVDEFLESPDRVNLEPFRALLDLSWVTRTIEGNNPPLYELVIESGYLVPGDPYFDQIVEILKVDTAELLAENVAVEQIDHYSVVITLLGHTGELVSRVTTAEFVSSAGRVELVASLNPVSAGPLVFSTPSK